MPQHAHLPVILGVDRAVLRFGADRRRIEQQLGAHQRHAAGSLRIPLIPTDADANLRVTRLPHFKPGIPRIKIKLLLIPRSVRDMALAVTSEDLAVGVDHGQRVVTGVVLFLIEADRKNHFQLLGHITEMLDRCVLLHLRRIDVVVGLFFLAEIRGFEQLLQQYNLCPLRRRLSNQLIGFGDILFSIG
ncbi:hypothetical protein D3C81_938970 [compost metagenome]